MPNEKPKSYVVSVSKTIKIPSGMALLLFQDPKMRKRWMKDPDVEVVKASDRWLRMKWIDGDTYVAITFHPKASNKTQVVVQHEGLPTAKSAERLNAYWLEQLEALKATVE